MLRTAKISILNYSDEMFENLENEEGEEASYDEKYEAKASVGHEVEECFSSNGLRWMSNKDIGLVAFSDKPDPLWYKNVVGATLYLERFDDRNKHVYDFDIAVKKDAQGGTVGHMLVSASIQDARSLDCDVIKLYVVNPLMHTMLTKMFGFKGSEPDTRGGNFQSYLYLNL